MKHTLVKEIHEVRLEVLGGVLRWPRIDRETSDLTSGTLTKPKIHSVHVNIQRLVSWLQKDFHLTSKPCFRRNIFVCVGATKFLTQLLEFQYTYVNIIYANYFSARAPIFAEFFPYVYRIRARYKDRYESSILTTLIDICFSLRILK